MRATISLKPPCSPGLRGQRLRAASACARRSARTCGTGRRRRSPPRRRRCRRALRGTGCRRRAGPSGSAAGRARPSSSARRACAAGISSSASSRISGSPRIACRRRRGRAAPARAHPAISTTGLELRVLARQGAEARVVGDHRRVGQQAADFLVALGQRLELTAQARRHRRFLKSRSAARSRSSVAVERGLAQRGARRVQQPVGELVREALQHLAPVLAGASCSRACASDCVARRRAIGCASCRSASWRPCACHHGHVVLDLQVDDGLGLLRRLRGARRGCPR